MPCVPQKSGVMLPVSLPYNVATPQKARMNVANSTLWVPHRARSYAATLIPPRS